MNNLIVSMIISATVLLSAVPAFSEDWGTWFDDRNTELSAILARQQADEDAKQKVDCQSREEAARHSVDILTKTWNAKDLKANGPIVARARKDAFRAAWCENIDQGLGHRWMNTWERIVNISEAIEKISGTVIQP